MAVKRQALKWRSQMHLLPSHRKVAIRLERVRTAMVLLGKILFDLRALTSLCQWAETTENTVYENTLDSTKKAVQNLAASSFTKKRALSCPKFQAASSLRAIHSTNLSLSGFPAPSFNTYFLVPLALCGTREGQRVWPWAERTVLVFETAWMSMHSANPCSEQGFFIPLCVPIATCPPHL